MGRMSTEKRQAEDTRRFCESVMVESWTGINPDWLDSGDPAERAKVAEWLESPDRGDPKFAEHAKAEREVVKYLTNWHKRARLMDWWRAALRERVKVVMPGRFDFAGSAVTNCREGGSGWCGDYHVLFRIDDAATRAKILGEKLVGKIGEFGRALPTHDIVDRYKFASTSELPEKPERLVWTPDDSIRMTATYRDEITGKTVRADYELVRILAEVFPGERLRYAGPGKPLLIRKGGELVGMVQPLAD